MREDGTWADWGAPSPCIHPWGLLLPFSGSWGTVAAATATLLTVASVASGLAGTVALVRRTGLGHGARPGVRSGVRGRLPDAVPGRRGLLARPAGDGRSPWAPAGIVSPSPSGARAWIGRLARIGLATAWSAMFVPLLVVVPIVFGLIWTMVARTRVPLITASAGSF